MGQDIIAVADQAASEMIQIARVMRAYFEALIERGFDNEQAIRLTIGYQQATFGKGPAS